MNQSTMMMKMHRALLLSLAVAMLMAVAAGTARADFGVQPGSFQSTVLDSTGAPVSDPQAGAHPYAQLVKFALNTINHSYPAPPPGAPGQPSGPDPDPDGSMKTVITDMPAGFLGNTQAVPRCDPSDFPPLFVLGPGRCPTATQVGVASLDLGAASGFPYPPGLFKVPVYNLVPPKGVVARFGFVEVAAIIIDITIRTGSDYGVTATVRNVSQAPNIYATSLTLWGVPADPSHDPERFLPGLSRPATATAATCTAACPRRRSSRTRPNATCPSRQGCRWGPGRTRTSCCPTRRPRRCTRVVTS